MSERLTKRWTKTLKEAFGATGEKGTAGELFFCDFYRKKGYKVVHYESERREQLKGIDVLIEKDNTQYTFDVKANLRNDRSFAVEHKPRGWLFNKNYTSDYICHVNPRTGVLVSYPRKKMQECIAHMLKEHPNLTFSNNDYVYISHVSFGKWETLEQLHDFKESS